MLIGLTIAGLLAAFWLSAAIVPVVRLGVTFRQGLLYAPLKLVYGIDERELIRAAKCKTPVIYAIIHRSKLDPAVMLSLLPDHTLHILDENSAEAAWLEPYRALAPTIAFNAKHVFVSRRLVRRLKGSGRLAVYLPDDVEPDPKSFRLYRAIARIASQADARIVPIDIAEAKLLPFSLTPSSRTVRRRFPCLRIRTLEGKTIAELVARSGESHTTRAHALFDRIAELRIAAARPERSLFRALRDAGRLHGPRRVAVQDPLSGELSYRRVFTHARILGRHVQGRTIDLNEAVGLLLPNSGLMVSAFMAIQSAGRLATLLHPGRPPEEILALLQTVAARMVISSRRHEQESGCQEMVEALEAGGIKFLWADEVLDATSGAGCWAARLGWRFPLVRRSPDDPAIALSAGNGGTEAHVFSQRAVLTNLLQLKTRIDISIADTVYNLLPAHDCAGLSGSLLSMMAGARVWLDTPGRSGAPASIRPTILIGTETLFNRMVQEGSPNVDLSRLRAAFAGGELVSAETRQAFRDKFKLEILDGYGMGEAAPVVAINSLTHSREGSVGRLLPGIAMRLEPAEDASRLWLSGTSLMQWVIRTDQPGKLQPLESWLDTGDLVTVDREGFLTLRGRLEDQKKQQSDEPTAA